MRGGTSWRGSGVHGPLVRQCRQASPPCRASSAAGRDTRGPYSTGDDAPNGIARRSRSPQSPAAAPCRGSRVCDPSGQGCLIRPASQGRQPWSPCRTWQCGWARHARPRRKTCAIVLPTSPASWPTDPHRPPRRGHACVTRPAREGRGTDHVPTPPGVARRGRRWSPLTPDPPLPRGAGEGVPSGSEAGVRGVRPRARTCAADCRALRRGRARHAAPLQGVTGEGRWPAHRPPVPDRPPSSL